MELTGNTVAITGGGTGIGRALAVALHRLGNRVVIAGRRPEPLRALTDAYPGVEWHPLDIADVESIQRFTTAVERRWPELNVLINNAGTMALESPAQFDPALAAAVVDTNLLGPITLTAQLLPMLMHRGGATIVNVTSALAFVPLAVAPTYCATKAGLHSYTDSLRILLRGSGVDVIEIAPPRVSTDMTGPGGAESVGADEFVTEIIGALSAQPEIQEVVVDAARALRYAERDGRYDRALAALNSGVSGEDVP